MLSVRSAQGSALALRTESFRRFLHASEAQHVEWAWKHDLIREYSGWAVALGEADAWQGRAGAGQRARAGARLGDAGDPRRQLVVDHVVARAARQSGGSGGGSGGGGGGGGEAAAAGSW